MSRATAPNSGLWPRWRIRSVLTGAMILLVVMAVGSMTVLDALHQRALFHEDLEQKGVLLAEVLNEILADALYFGDAERARQLSDLVQATAEVERYRVFLTDGRVMVDSAASKYAGGEIDPQTLEIVLASREVVIRRSSALEVLSPIYAGSEVLGGVVISLDANSIEPRVQAMIVQHVWQGLLAIALGVAFAYLLARWFTLPVQQLIHAAGRVASGDLTFSAGRTRRDEIGGDLAVAFEKMVRGLEERANAQAQEHTVQLEKANELLRQHAMEDSLTGLPNRRLLLDRLAVATAKADRQQSCVAILFLDLDQFKVINDSLGHIFGDKILREIGQRLKQTIRQGDTVARLGGDEFTVVVPELDRPEDAARIAQQLVDLLRQPLLVDGRDFLLTASIGISIYPDDGRDFGELLKNADIAMYRAKELGRNSYQFYAGHMGRLAVARLELEGDIRQALDRGEFIAYYQPQLELESGRITTAEALIRWQHPTRGLLEAEEFVYILERTGRMDEIDRYVLHQSAALFRTWQERYGIDLKLAVNLSARHFARPDLLSEIGAILEATGLDPHALELEITETMAVRYEERGLETLKGLDELGISISIDDFGTGYSSLSYLRRFPISKLKIDREFVGDALDNRDAAAIVEAIISLSHSLGLRVTAEGVETEAQQRYLEELGCHEIQGYWVQRPLSPERFEELLASRSPGVEAAGA